MSSEQGCNGGDLLFDIKRSHTQHPFIEQCCNFLIGKIIEVVETFNHFSYCIGKNTGFVIVAISVHRIYPEVFPHGVKESVPITEKRLEVD